MDWQGIWKRRSPWTKSITTFLSVQDLGMSHTFIVQISFERDYSTMQISEILFFLSFFQMIKISSLFTKCYVYKKRNLIDVLRKKGMKWFPIFGTIRYAADVRAYISNAFTYRLRIVLKSNQKYWFYCFNTKILYYLLI